MVDNAADVCLTIRYLAHTESQALQSQQVGSEEAAREGEGRQGPAGVAPYTLKCANHLGDVRLQNCPKPDEHKVLYFTAQWENEGGGVYDVAKFMQPEVRLKVQYTVYIDREAAFSTYSVPCCVCKLLAGIA